MDNKLKDSAIHCSSCNGLIHYGDSIIADPTNDKAYCGIECYLDSNDCYMLYPDDEDAADGYNTWFNEAH